jgi:SAM-dependent methyltransferase
MNTGPSTDRRDDAGWNDRASRWLAFDDEMERFAAPLGELAMEKLRPAASERLLDVGCGTGWSTVSLAGRVGSTGHVVGIDVSAVMAERARQTSRGLPNVEILCADAARYEFAVPFDAVFSRFGLMFFDAPEVAFCNVRRALRPGGRLAFVSWADVATNDWLMITGLAALSVTRTFADHSPCFRCEPFSLSDPAAVTSLLDRAGFRDIRVTPRIKHTTMTEHEAETRLQVSTTVTGLREALDGLAEDVQRRVVDAVRASLRARLRNGRIRLRVGVLVVEARR